MPNHRPAWAPDEVDIERPSAARMYDYYLGGSYNFAADRALAEENLKNWPDMPHIARANRGFLHRAVTYLSSLGVDQFLDLGSGIPTGGNTHDIALSLNPRSRTVYVDMDPVAIAHSIVLLQDVPNATVVHADLRDVDAVMKHSVVPDFLDLSRPIGVIMLAVLHFVAPEDDAPALVGAYRDAMAQGSYLAISHGTADYQPESARGASELYTRASHQLVFRSKAEVAQLFIGYELVEPGLVDIIHWRPELTGSRPDPLDGDVTRYSGYVGVGRKPSA
ncbi:SAM-dependent methyltransferase [Actinospica durhamensis]|uniref:SAM-dependent methyltransferase n=1 Tax=Actinospica durhamensis TaxID=1508375 RepID=A0A941ESG4_9ACTN|nr:SAM-dependent methyltransferase [Actinospica durhamensis]MBR7837227.1 SAM-dependent methyltransferase [Actinospica durhamensis]